jgi:hypothetical protein
MPQVRRVEDGIQEIRPQLPTSCVNPTGMGCQPHAMPSIVMLPLQQMSNEQESVTAATPNQRPKPLCSSRQCLPPPFEAADSLALPSQSRPSNHGLDLHRGTPARWKTFDPYCEPVEAIRPKRLIGDTGSPGSRYIHRKRPHRRRNRRLPLREGEKAIYPHSEVDGA